MSHQLHIQAINSKSAKMLDKILNQWDSFCKTMDGFDDEHEGAYLMGLLIDNNLVEPFNKTLPYLMIPCEDLQAMLMVDHKSVNVYIWIISRLNRLGVCKSFIYQYRQTQEPMMVFVWNEDLPKLSKRLRSKIVPVVMEK